MVELKCCPGVDSVLDLLVGNKATHHADGRMWCLGAVDEGCRVGPVVDHGDALGVHTLLDEFITGGGGDRDVLTVAIETRCRAALDPPADFAEQPGEHNGPLLPMHVVDKHDDRLPGSETGEERQAILDVDDGINTTESAGGQHRQSAGVDAEAGTPPDEPDAVAYLVARGEIVLRAEDRHSCAVINQPPSDPLEIELCAAAFGVGCVSPTEKDNVAILERHGAGLRHVNGCYSLVRAVLWPSGESRESTVILPGMSWVESWKLFRERRLDVPVDDDALVLDVGSGDKPSWRADVLLDLYAGAEFAAQRSGRREARVSRPLFDADAADMPFADGAFDYAICSNLLEHVLDPVGVARELQRVAKAGYIEVPEAASAKIVDFPSHVWWCRLDEGDPEGPTLVFTAKDAPFFDPEINAYIERAGVRQALDDVLNSKFDHRVIQFHWKDSFHLRTEGELAPQFVDEAMAAEGHRRGWETVAVQAVTAALTWPVRRRRRDVRLRFNDIVKPELRRAQDEVLTNKIYRAG